MLLTLAASEDAVTPAIGLRVAPGGTVARGETGWR